MLVFDAAVNSAGAHPLCCALHASSADGQTQSSHNARNVDQP
jgi:hypothetical protein